MFSCWSLLRFGNITYAKNLSVFVVTSAHDRKDGKQNIDLLQHVTLNVDFRFLNCFNSDFTLSRDHKAVNFTQIMANVNFMRFHVKA